MAANKEEMNKSEELKKTEEMNKTEMKKTLDVSSQDKFITNVIKHTNTFLTLHQLAQFRQTSKKIYEAGSSEALLAQKKLSEELLHYVFQADPKKVAEYFAKPNSCLKSILEKTAYREGYQSEKLKKFVLFRYWPNMSPLQAAAICGDNFLVRKLLTYIIEEEIVTQDSTLRLKAAAQLQEILESQHYLISFNDLIKAYNEYLSQYEKLLSHAKSNEINKLWEKVGECHKRLSRYGLQEFFDAKLFDPPTFDTEPNRGALQEWNKLFELDSIGDGTSLGLLKGLGPGCCETWGTPAWPKGVDSTAINHLFELRKTELEKIIKCLQDHEEAICFIILDIGTSQKQKAQHALAYYCS